MSHLTRGYKGRALVLAQIERIASANGEGSGSAGNFEIKPKGNAGLRACGGDGFGDGGFTRQGEM